MPKTFNKEVNDYLSETTCVTCDGQLKLSSIIVVSETTTKGLVACGYCKRENEAYFYRE